MLNRLTSEWEDFKEARVKDGLHGAYDRCADGERDIDLDREPLIVFSDHHKGGRDYADDFWRSEAAYAAALGHYLELGYRLVVLGDAEELWEEKREKVLSEYSRTLALEGEFLDKGGYERLWGNHDPDWNDEDTVTSALLPALGASGQKLRVKEGLRLRVTAGGQRGTLFLTHGHQGTLDSDELAWISKPAVRGWASVQRRLKRGWNSPARDNQLRAPHDRAMFRWAEHHEDRPVLIAGHTHRPVFWARDRQRPDVSELDAVLKRLRQSGAPPREIAVKRSELEAAHALQEGVSTPDLAPTKMVTPCYFNTGCCSFADGAVTGIELTGEWIRLVRWPWPLGKREWLREVIDELPLSRVLEAVRKGAAD